MVKAGAVVEYAIVAENAVIGEGARVGAPPEDDKPEEWGIAVVAEGIKVGDGQEDLVLMTQAGIRIQMCIRDRCCGCAW